MKHNRKYLFLILFLIFILSCKHKASHEEALNYYVVVALQTKEVINSVKAFSPTLLKFIKQDSLHQKTAEEINAFTNYYSHLLVQIDKCLIVLNNLKPVNNGALIKLFAEFYVKDITRVLVAFHSLAINKYVSEKYKLNTEAIVEIRSGKRNLESDNYNYQKYLREFEKEYNLSINELTQYGLE